MPGVTVIWALVTGTSPTPLAVTVELPAEPAWTVNEELLELPACTTTISGTEMTEGSALTRSTTMGATAVCEVDWYAPGTVNPTVALREVPETIDVD